MTVQTQRRKTKRDKRTVVEFHTVFKADEGKFCLNGWH